MDILKLNGHLPQPVINEIQSVIDKFQINTTLRLSHFLAQCSHESGGFKVLNENLNYSADGLKKIFGKYFPNDELANLYARNPEKIASKVYSNRMGNSDEASKEGYKFRGRGYIQLTGKSNYILFGKSINEDMTTNPDLVSTKYPLLSAAWFFNKNGLNEISDKGPSNDIITSITKKINGGTIGLDDRIAQFNKIYPLLS